MSTPLMPKATAIWLLENTSLTFTQIADYCQLHVLEIQAIADGEIAVGMAPFDPIAHGTLSREEVERCSLDPNTRLASTPLNTPLSHRKRGGGKYTPVSKRQDKPNAIAWLLKHHPELSDAQICRLLGTTNPTIHSLRNRTHWNAANIRGKSPVLLGLCTQVELNQAIAESEALQKSE
ncbi:MAG: DUF1013 domain-containing protein [Alphaproteobacteria bacterium]|nr:DUF1013 domain-containing protein [Alphaproteobacteria bacterium]